MKKTARRTIRILLIISLLLLCGCGTIVKTHLPDSAPATRSVTDCAGRRVIVPAKISRIACLCPESGHAAALLGRGDLIVAVVEGMKRDVLLNRLYPSISQAVVPKVNGKINIEELLRCGPEVIFIKAETFRDAGEMKKLNKAGIPYVVLEYRSITEQRQAIRMMGQILSNPKKAAAYDRFYSETLSRTENRLTKIAPADRVTVYHSINEATRTDTPKTLPADWLQAAGAENVSLHDRLRPYEGKYYASLEQILLWNPSVMLINEPGVADYILRSPQWTDLRAVKTHQVYQMPIGLSRWGHPSSLETPLAIAWTAQKLYPDLFKDVDMKQEVRSFYDDFFGLSLTNQQIEQILTGTDMRQAKASLENTQ